MVDLYGINYKTNFKNQIVYLEKSKPQTLRKIEIENKMLIEDINQIYDQEYKIKIYKQKKIKQKYRYKQHICIAHLKMKL